MAIFKCLIYLLIVFVCTTSTRSHQEDTKSVLTYQMPSLNAAANSHSVSNRNVNSRLLDATTALLHHVENTRKCGNNLQRLREIDLEPFWSAKLDAQVRKAILLANSLNHLINSEPTAQQAESFSIYQSAQKASQPSLNYYTKIVDSTFLSSLSHFIFSSSSSSSSSRANLFSYSESSESKNEQHKENLFKQEKRVQPETGSVSNDPFILGYGVVLFSPNKLHESPRCLFISNDETNVNKAPIVTESKTCLAMNIQLNNEQAFQGIDLDNQAFNKVFSNGNGNSLNEDQTSMCLNWFDSLRKKFKQFTDSKQFESTLKQMSYEKFLRNFLSSSVDHHSENINTSSSSSAKTNHSTIWCGPYYECSANKNEWILIYSLPLFDQDKQLKGALVFKFQINKMDINQCDSGDPIFEKSHKCKSNSQCIFTPSNQFRSGSYRCKCRAGFINTDVTLNAYDGRLLEKQYWLMKSMKNNTYMSDFNCLSCSTHECCSIDPNQFDRMLAASSREMNFTELNAENIFWNCRQYNRTLRYAILIIQIVFIMITLSLAVIIFASRQNKIIKHSMWVLLELILFGALFLYSTVILQNFEPSTNICISLPWLRELGFTVIYGILNLRLYKILVEFQSRKAHCVQLKEKDILKILFLITICVFGYLTAWTLVDLDYANEGFSMVTNTSLKGFIQYPVCKIKWWDYFIEIAEFLFICAGFYLLYCTRTAPSDFNERKFISIVIYSEAFSSTLMHIIKHSIYTSIHPDTILILYFLRCHTTVTLMIFFLFITKICFLIKSNSEEYTRNSRLSTTEANDPAFSSDNSNKVHAIQTLTSGNTADHEIGEISLRDMQPEEIRSELRRLYTQLHVFKTKSLKQDNPHIQKKHKSNKKLRRLSISLQRHQNRDNESYQVRTPDESLCSANETNMLSHSIAYSMTNTNANDQDR